MTMTDSVAFLDVQFRGMAEGAWQMHRWAAPWQHHPCSFLHSEVSLQLGSGLAYAFKLDPQRRTGPPTTKRSLRYSSCEGGGVES